jgi:hypothetical protein
MKSVFRASLVPAALFGALLSASPAFAHIDLLEPEARAHGTGAPEPGVVDVNSDQKTGPCGQMTNGRTDRVTTYAPGQTITVRVREETPHESYIRVAIDTDGDNDFPTRPGPVAVETQEQAQAAEDALQSDGLLKVYRETNNTAGFVHEIQVTLPNETCDNCTLQVIQLMFATAQTYYYQCADIVIADGGTPDPVASGAGGAPASSGGSGGVNSAGSGGGVTTVASGGVNSVAAGGAPPSGSTNNGAANNGTAGARASGAGGAAAASAGQAGTATAPGTGGAAGPGSVGAVVVGSDDADEDDGGCSLSTVARGSAGMSLLSMIALGVGLARRRRS